MLAAGIVEPTVSEWAANVVLAKKRMAPLGFVLTNVSSTTNLKTIPIPSLVLTNALMLYRGQVGLVH